MPPKNRMDALTGLDDVSDSDEASSSGSEGEEEPQQQPAKKAKKQEIDLETLQRHGLKEGPSVLFVPEKRDDGANFAWDSGREHKGKEEEEESGAQREANRAAVTSGADGMAQYALAAQAQAAALREAKKEEHARLRADKKFSWNDKEKRKRQEGKVSRGGNYVEEEKRRAREFGIFSGFD